MEKNTGKVREKSGNFVSPEKWEPWLLILDVRQRFPLQRMDRKGNCWGEVKILEW